MSRFEREKISRYVLKVSQVFAALAGAGILIIGIQLFSKTTGLGLFDIKYSLSGLFSDDPEPGPVRITETGRTSPLTATTEPGNADPAITAQIKAAAFLKELVSVKPIKPTESLPSPAEPDKQKRVYTPIDIPSLLPSVEPYRTDVEDFYYEKMNPKGVLPTVKEAKYSRWSAGISLTPCISFTRVKYVRLSEISTGKVGNTQYGFYQTQKERNRMNQALLKYALGLDVFMRINKKWSLQSGLTYFQAGESVLVKEIGDENLTRLTSGQSLSNDYFSDKPDFESPQELMAENNMRYANNLSFFEIPLIVQYNIKTIDKLSEIGLQCGVSATKLDYVSAMVYNFDNDGYYLITGSDPEVYQKYGSNLILGLSASKYITNTIQFFANPQIKAGLTNIFDSGYNMRQRYLLTGVRLGMKINL